MGQLRPALSQMDGLHTTVPLNMNPDRHLSTRHTPTRRSLQRSRFLHARIQTGRRRPRMRYYRLLLVLVAVQLLVGVALSAVAIFTATVSPSLRLRDLPHWAGIPLIISGLVGVIFVTRCYGDYISNPISNISKGISVSLTAVCIVLCACAVTFLSLHMVVFSNFDECRDGPYKAPLAAADAVTPINQSEDDDHTVLAYDETGSSSNSGSSAADEHMVTCTCWQEAGGGLRRLHIYEAIACSDVLALIKFLFIVMSILGCGGALGGAAYVFLLWSFRYKDVYVGVRSPVAAAGLIDPSLTVTTS